MTNTQCNQIIEQMPYTVTCNLLAVARFRNKLDAVVFCERNRYRTIYGDNREWEVVHQYYNDKDVLLSETIEID